MSDREEGSVHTSPSGSIKETSPELVIEKAPSSTGSIRESHSRSKSPQSQKSNGSKKSPSAAGTVTLVKSSSPPRHSRSRSRSTSRRRYRSRSRSHSGGRRRYYYSRSRSRSPRRSRRRSSDRRRHRSHSRSPMSSRRRHVGDREAPTTSRCLGVFGLSLYTQERDLRDLFSRYGPLDEVQIVHDHQTGRSRGFSFVYFRNLEDAVEARERAIGSEIDGRKIRVDYSITQRAHTPTPGIYLGKPTPGHHEYPPGPRSGSYSGERRSSGHHENPPGPRSGSYSGERRSSRTRRSPSRGYRNGGNYGRRSPSPCYNRRRYSRSRSRSRSYSPRVKEE